MQLVHQETGNKSVRPTSSARYGLRNSSDCTRDISFGARASYDDETAKECCLVTHAVS